MGIVYNFLSLSIIGDFDNYIFDAFTVPMSPLCEHRQNKEEILIVNHTTSIRCDEKELSSVPLDDESGTFRPLRVTFKSRSW